MTTDVKTNDQNKTVTDNKEASKQDSAITELSTDNNTTAADAAPAISQEEIQELLSMRKEMQQNKLKNELYNSVGGKEEYERIFKHVENNASKEQKDAINSLLRNQETAKQALAIMQGLATQPSTPSQPTPVESPLPAIGEGTSAAVGTNTQTSEEEKMNAPQIEMADSITYSNVKDPLVKKALDRIDNDVIEFQNKHGHENFDSGELIHEMAIKHLEPIVNQAEKFQNRERAEEALLAYDAILRPYVKQAVANEDPIPARLVENAKQLVEQRNIDNRLTGREKLDYFADMFTVDEARQQTIDSLFVTKKEFTF